MKKTIIISLFLVLSIGCHGQSGTENIETIINHSEQIKLDSIPFSKVCFEGVCLGDSISKAFGIWGKPNRRRFNTDVGEMEDSPVPSNTYAYIQNLEAKFVFEEWIEDNFSDRVCLIRFNSTKQFDDYIKIHDSLSVVSQKFPNSFITAFNRKELNEKGNGQVYIKIYDQPKEYIGVTAVQMNFKNGRVTQIFTPEDE